MRKRASKYWATLLSKENSFNGVQFKDVRITSVRRISLFRNAKSLHVRWMRLAALCLDRKKYFLSFLFFFRFHGFYGYMTFLVDGLSLPY